MSRRILVVGVPRSGTSWIGSVLSRAPGAVYVNEPDSPEVNPAAAAAVDGLWRRGRLGPRDEAPALYEALWADAFRAPRIGALRRSARAVVVKSVKSHGGLEWVAERYAPRVVIVRANPLSVVSSWLAMGWRASTITEPWLAQWRPDLLAAVGGWPSDPIEQLALEVGTAFCVQEELIARHPGWTVVEHEALCADPAGGFEALFEDVGLEFTDEVRAFIASTNRPGVRHDITRIPTQAPRRWERLEPNARAQALAILERLPLAFEAPVA